VAFELMRAAYESLSKGEPDRDLALVASQLARYAYFVGKGDGALEWVETALDLAEALQYPEALAEALNAKATILWRRPHESGALLREAVKVARDHDLIGTALRAQFNLSGLAIEHDRLEEARAILDDALALAQRRGDRVYESMVLGQLSEVHFELGDWEKAAECAQLSPVDGVSSAVMLKGPQLIRLALGRGDVDEAREMFDLLHATPSSDLQDKANNAVSRALVLRAEGRVREAHETAIASLPDWRVLRQFHYLAEAVVIAVETALELDDVETAAMLVAEIDSAPPIERRPALSAEAARLRAKIAARRGEDASPDFASAAAAFAALKMPVRRATTLVEHADWLAANGGRSAALALAAEAREPLARVGATPWLERADALASVAPTAAG
jgi:tetratricopeptide (TPR) repeat protein